MSAAAIKCSAAVAGGSLVSFPSAWCQYHRPPILVLCSQQQYGDHSDHLLSSFQDHFLMSSSLFLFYTENSQKGNRTLKIEYPPPKRILAGEVLPGHCRDPLRRPSMPRGRKRRVGQPRPQDRNGLWCEADLPTTKKTAELPQQFSGAPRFGKHSLICAQFNRETSETQEDLFSESETDRRYKFDHILLQKLRRTAHVSSTQRRWHRCWASPAPPPMSCCTSRASLPCGWGAAWWCQRKSSCSG